MLLDWFTVAAQAVNFLILVWVLHRFVFRPILGAAARREERIAERLDQAARAREQAQAERERARDLRRELEQARDEAMAKADAEAQARLDKALARVDAQAREREAQWERRLEGRSEELSRDIRALVGRQAVDIARRALADMAGRALEDSLADSLGRRLDAVARELDPCGAGRLEVRAPGALGEEAAGRLRRALAGAFPDTEVTVTRDGASAGPGLVLACGDRRLEWTLERYLAGLEQDVQATLQTHGSRQ